MKNSARHKRRPLLTKLKTPSKTPKIASNNNWPMQIIVDDRLIVLLKVFEDFKRVFLVLSTKKSPYLSALQQKLLDDNLR